MVAAGAALPLWPARLGAADPKFIRHPRGGIVPADLAADIAAQRDSARMVLSFLSKIEGALPKPVFSKDQPSADYRDLKIVTEVQSQGQCGSCWAFAAIAAFESAYCLINKVELDLSEQMALDCAAWRNSCTGGWPADVFRLFASRAAGAGAVNDKDYTRYDVDFPLKGRCTPKSSIRYVADTWGYVDDQNVLSNGAPVGMPSREAIKQALCDYGPLAVAVKADDYWNRYCKTDDNGVPNPDWPMYPDEVFIGVPSQTDGWIDTDHIVMIIGWDDRASSHGAWLIKNSWGKKWGNQGFMKLAYDTCNIGFAAMWIKAQPAHVKYDADILHQLGNLNLGGPADKK